MAGSCVASKNQRSSAAERPHTHHAYIQQHDLGLQPALLQHIDVRARLVGNLHAHTKPRSDNEPRRRSSLLSTFTPSSGAFPPQPSAPPRRSDTRATREAYTRGCAHSRTCACVRARMRVGRRLP